METAQLPRLSSATRIFSNLIPTKSTGQICEFDTVCHLCGHDIFAGELFTPNFEMKKTFSSWGWIKRHAQKTHICSSCVNVLNAKFMRECQSCVMADDGVYRLNSSSDIAALILNPPKGSFAAWRSIKKMQHMAWRAPVNTAGDHSIFFMMFDEESLLIRTKMVIEGYKAWRLCEDYLKECGTKAVVGPTSVKLSGADIGSLSPYSRSIIEAGADSRPDLRRALNIFDSLGIGEWLGLYAMCNAKDENDKSMNIDANDKSTWPVLRPMPQTVMQELSAAAGCVDDQDE